MLFDGLRAWWRRERYPLAPYLEAACEIVLKKRAEGLVKAAALRRAFRKSAISRRRPSSNLPGILRRASQR